MNQIIKYFFLDGWASLEDVMAVLDYYSLNEFQLFVIHRVFTDDLFAALEDYLIRRITDYLSIA